MKEIIIKTKEGEHTRYLFDSNENCPICGTPLRDTYVQWAMFHGEVNRSCCDSPWQVKDFYVDEDKQAAYREYFDEINKPGMSECKVGKNLWEPLREAFKKYGVQSCQDERVYNELKHLVN